MKAIDVINLCEDNSDLKWFEDMLVQQCKSGMPIKLTPIIEREYNQHLTNLKSKYGSEEVTTNKGIFTKMAVNDKILTILHQVVRNTININII